MFGNVLNTPDFKNLILLSRLKINFVAVLIFIEKGCRNIMFSTVSKISIAVI